MTHSLEVLVQKSLMDEMTMIRWLGMREILSLELLLYQLEEMEWTSLFTSPSDTVLVFIYCPTPRLEYWGGKCSEPQSASEHASLTSHQSYVQIQYLTPAGWNGWCMPVDLHVRLGYSQYDVDNYNLTQLLNTSASYR